MAQPQRGGLCWAACPHRVFLRLETVSLSSLPDGLNGLGLACEEGSWEVEQSGGHGSADFFRSSGWPQRAASPASAAPVRLLGSRLFKDRLSCPPDFRAPAHTHSSMKLLISLRV